MRGIKIFVLILIIIWVSIQLIPVRYWQYLYEYLLVPQDQCIENQCIEYLNGNVTSQREGDYWSIHLLGNEYSHRMMVYPKIIDVSKLRYKGGKTIGNKIYKIYAYPEYLSDDRDRFYIDQQGGYSINIDSITNWEDSVDEFLLSIVITDLDCRE